jgi:elongation factor Ts
MVHDIALHIAASQPKYVTYQDIPDDHLAKEKDLIIQELTNEGKSLEMREKIAEGKIKKWYGDVCLLDQPFVKNPDQTVGEYIKQHIAKLGENIVVRRFERIELGQI